MGITIRCKKTGLSCDLGYRGFARFRTKVAYLLNEEFGEHYEKLYSPKMMFAFDEKNHKQLYDDFDRETERLIQKHRLSKRIVGFLFESDCDGKCSPAACKAVYGIIKDYDDGICYGYAGRSDCTMFRNMKALFLECSETNSYLEWC